MPHSDCALLWLRRDLRLADHPALTHACRRHQVVIPVYIHTPDDHESWSMGAASRLWLDASLRDFAAALREHSSRLIIRQGTPEKILPELAAETGASAVYWNRLYDPATIEQDTLTARSLGKQGINTQAFGSYLLCEPAQLRTQSDTPYRVFTPFWRNLQQQTFLPPQPPPARIPAPQQGPTSLTVDRLSLSPDHPWTQRVLSEWAIGENAAQQILKNFCDQHLAEYASARDLPGVPGTSRLSTYLHFGELSPRQVWHAVSQASTENPLAQPGAEAFLRELGWREFAQHVLVHYPHTTDQPMQARFSRYPWADDWERTFKVWQRGETGYPLVDAAMQQLWQTGWIHNRARMVAASFLVKNLRVPWQAGARWFWDTLLDADLAANTLGWQWVTGCGVDAAPYYRLFNPMRQGKRFDPDGTYVHRWLPQLTDTPVRQIHQPWRTPIVDFDQSRAAALAGLKSIQNPDG